jgi:PKHD-type hydroxylase
MIVKALKRLDPKVLKKVLRLKAELPPEEAKTYTDHADRGEQRDAALRRTEVRWIMHEQHLDVHQALLRVAAEYQEKLGVRGAIYIERGVQLSTYRVGDHFDWHFDGLPSDATRRSVSMSVLLSEDFEGGKLEFRTPGAPRLKKAGDVVLFNSGEIHRVTKVTAGIRDSLVVWFTTG